VPEFFWLIKRSRASEKKAEQNHRQSNRELATDNYTSNAGAFRREEMRDKKRDSDCQAVVFGRDCDAGQKAGNDVISRAWS
jgi:hypothetical protein